MKHSSTRHRFCRWFTPVLVAVATGLFRENATGQTPLTLTKVALDLPGPVGIGYAQSSSKVMLSVNFFPNDTCNGDPSPSANNFALLATDGTLSPYATYANSNPPEFVHSLGEELKLIGIRVAVGSNPFQVGDVFTGTGKPGEVLRIPANGQVPWTWVNGKRVPTPFVTLSEPGYPAGNTGYVRNIIHDDYGTGATGNLIVTTDEGDVWEVTAAGGMTRLAKVTQSSGRPVGLEACIVVPNDSAKYGPLAGGPAGRLILVGADSMDIGEENTQGFCFYFAAQGLWVVNRSRAQNLAINPTTVPVELTINGARIRTEDLDFIRPAENLFAVSNPDKTVFTVPAATGQFAGMDNDILLTNEEDQKLSRLWYNPATQQLQLDDFALNTVPGGFEHVTFAPITVAPVVSLTATVASTVEGSATPATFNLHRSVSGPDLEVRLQLGGSATVDVDYSTANLASVSWQIYKVTIPDGQTDLSVDIVAFDDSRAESAESVICTVKADVPPAGQGPAYTVAAAPAEHATVTITDNDGMAMPTGWKLYDLGVLGTGNQSWANAIGPVVNGTTARIVGASRYGSLTNTRAFTYTATPTASGPGGSMLAPYPAASWSTANAVEDSGGIAGQFYWNSKPSAFVLPSGSAIMLLSDFGASALANAAAIVGGSSRYTVGTANAFANLYPPNGIPRATLWVDEGLPIDLHSLDTTDGNNKSSYAYAVNRNGRVVGKAQGASGAGANFHAFRTQANLPIDPLGDDLGTPLVSQGYNYSEAAGINDLDETVGSCGSYAIFWQGHGVASSAWFRLYVNPSGGSDYCGARAINHKGLIVGWRYSGYYGQNVPMVWWNNSANSSYDLQSKEYGFAALNTTVIGGGTWNLQYASAINDSNWIVGWGNLTKNGVTQSHAYLLKPN